MKWAQRLNYRNVTPCTRFRAGSIEVTVDQEHTGLNVVALNLYYLVDGTAPVRIPGNVNDATDRIRNRCIDGGDGPMGAFHKNQGGQTR